MVKLGGNMLKQVLDYKHDTTRYYGNTSNLREVKSKHYKHMYYVLDGNKLVATIGLDTIAKDNHRIAQGLNKGASATELEMYNEELTNKE